MRKLMCFTIGFAAACAAGAYLLYGIWLPILSIVAIIASVGVSIIAKNGGKVAVTVLLGAAVAFMWFFAVDTFYLSGARACDGEKLDISAQITDYSYKTDYGIAADAKIDLNGNNYRVRVYLYRDMELSPGMRVEGELRLRYTAAGGSEKRTYHQGEGIFLLGYFDEDAVVHTAPSIEAKHFPTVLRKRITNMLDSIFPADTLAFARALLLGDTSLLGYEESTDLSVSGIRHVVAVSGLHVSILFGVLIALVGYRRVITPVLGFAMLLLFAALAGFTPSVVRACVMQSMMLLSMTIRKEYDGPTALSLAVLLMLVINPLTVTSVSFQLSVGCMVGILAFSGKISQFLLNRTKLGPAKGKSLKARISRAFVGSVSVSLSAMTVTTPLSALYFGAVSIVSVVTNLLTLSVVTVLFCGIIAACVAGAIWLPLGKCIAWIFSWLARYVLFVSKTVASFPLSAVYTRSIYIVIWLVMTYALVAVFLLAKKKRAGVFIGCILAGLCVSVGLSWLEPKLDDYRMTILDVGQGQCILLQTDGKHYVIDCGGGNSLETADLAAQTLLSQGIFRLDGVILTHYDLDHAGAVNMLLSRIPADSIYLPDIADSGTIRKELEMQRMEDIIYIPAEQSLSIENGTINLFTGKAGINDNESSMCVLFQPGNCDILITGDRNVAGERVLLEQTELPDLEVLVVGHHGSKYATCLELLNATKPEVAVISVGGDNHYGHPADETLDRLLLFGCYILRTDTHGDVIFRG